MKVVVDTNVLISAAWRDKSPEAVIIWIAFQDDWEWVVSQEILGEYQGFYGARNSSYQQKLSGNGIVLLRA